MDSSFVQAGKPPSRRELQGPRPTPLKVNKDSHKIKKPPLAPPPQQQHQAVPSYSQPLKPVIIYTVSPKVIHTDPSHFMNLVQRLTGKTIATTPTTCSASPLASNSCFDAFNNDPGGVISPAARYASIEKLRSVEVKKHQSLIETMEENGIEKFFQGILSPGPASLPKIPASFFSPNSDTNLHGLFHDLMSPVVYGNKSYIEGSFMPSPSSFISPQMISSPSITSLDIFNNFSEF